MNRVRFLLLTLAGLVVLLLAALALAFNSTFQTYVARQALASKPALNITVAEVEAGWDEIRLRQIRIEQQGAVLTVPGLEAQMPVLTAAFGREVLISRLVARGWILDLSQTDAVAVPPPPEDEAAMDVRTILAGMFGGLFGDWVLPVDLELDGLVLEGEVILPAQRGRMNVSFGGGALRAGGEGRFEMEASAQLAERAVHRLDAIGTITMAMDSPRSIRRVETTITATATGERFPDGVTLTGSLLAARAEAGETYQVMIATPERQLLLLKGALARPSGELDGTWQLNVRDADIAPFLLGRALPVFAIEGSGDFGADGGLVGVRAAGQMEAKADQLGNVAPAFAAMGAIALEAEFDLAQQADVLRVEKLEIRLDDGQPVAALRSLQTFEFNPRTGALAAAIPTSELFDVVLTGVPLTWADPLWAGVELRGGGLRGGIVATPLGGGLALRVRTPLTATGVEAGRAGQPLWRDVDVAAEFSADYTPLGWQAEVARLTLRSGGTTFLELAGKAGRLAGTGQPLKSTGRFLIDLPGVLAQPLAGGTLALFSGEATFDFVASSAATTEVQVNIGLKKLVAADGSESGTLPDIEADIRADFASDGRISFHAPLRLELDGRRSDLTLTGSLRPGPDGRTFDAQLTSTQLYADDAKILALALAERDGSTANHSETGRRPAWHGLQGSLALDLKQVTYSDLFQASDVAGTLRFDAGAIRFERIQAGLGETGGAKINGAVTFDPGATMPYGLKAELMVADYDPAKLFLALNPAQPPTVEGRFNIASSLASRAVTLGDLALGVEGEFQLTSKAGTFRGLPVSAAARLESLGVIAAGIARLGSLASAIGGKGERAPETIENRAQAVSKLAAYWKAIPYDQLSVTISRDAALNTTLRDFTLISPEIRLSGSGTATHRAGASFLDDAIAVEFQLRARGQHAELLKYLNALEEPPDELGYRPSSLPLKMSGTLAEPDTSELNERLAALALERSGLGDRATELFNRLRGAGKE